MPAGERIGDERMILRARAGSPDALAELYDRFGDRIYATAYRLTRYAADAEDILQDVFANLPENLERYDGEASLETWLKQVTVRAALMVERTRERRREVRLPALPSADDLLGRAPPPTLDAVVLQRAIERLPERYRLVFILKEVEGYSHAEVADFLGITVTASQSRLSRARKRIRRRLAR